MGKSSDNSCCAEWEEQTIAAHATAGRHRRRRERGRLYIFAVTTLAVFLAGLLVRPPAPIGYEFETTIRHTVTGDATAAAALLATDPTDEITDHCQQVATKVGDNASPTCKIDILSSADPSDATARTILVRHRHESKVEGLACLTRTVDRFISTHNRADDQAELTAKRDEAASHLQFWETRVTAVERELAEYVQFATKRQDADGAIAPGQFGADLPVAAASQVTNPRWESLSRQFHDADIRLRGLQQRFTDVHPHVIEAQRVVAALERVLDATPQYIAASHASTSDSQNTDPNPVHAEPPSNHRDVSKSPTYVALNESLQEALESRRLAAEALRELPANGSAIVEAAMIDQPIRLAQVVRSPIDRSFLISQLVPAVLLGLAMTIPRSRISQPPTLYSSADVEESLDLPVYGTLSTSGEPPPPLPVISPLAQSTQRIVIACELAVVASVLVIIACAVISPGFTVEAVQDPLGAIGSVLQRLGVYR